MAHISIHRVWLEPELDGHKVPEVAGHNLSDHIESDDVHACAVLLQRLDALHSGEALVVWKD